MKFKNKLAKAILNLYTNPIIHGDMYEADFKTPDYESDQLLVTLTLTSEYTPYKLTGSGLISNSSVKKLTNKLYDMLEAAIDAMENKITEDKSGKTPASDETNSISKLAENLMEAFANLPDSDKLEDNKWDCNECALSSSSTSDKPASEPTRKHPLDDGIDYSIQNSLDLHINKLLKNPGLTAEQSVVLKSLMESREIYLSTLN